MEKSQGSERKREREITYLEISAPAALCAAKCPARYMYARRAREHAFISPPRALYLQKIIRARSAAPCRLFSVPRCTGAARRQLNRLVHDRANLRARLCRNGGKKKGEHSHSGGDTGDIAFPPSGFVKGAWPRVTQFFR